VHNKKYKKLHKPFLEQKRIFFPLKRPKLEKKTDSDIGLILGAIWNHLSTLIQQNKNEISYFLH
jgi:hypothetical protein